MSIRRGRMSARADVVVLGAGMVGVGVALNLQKRGRDVVLIDRRGAGEETSYGNAGLIQREAVIPYTFPREFGTILSYAMNNRRDAVYHLSALPRFAPWLFRYWRNASARADRALGRGAGAPDGACVKEHDALIAEAGGTAGKPRALKRLAQLSAHRGEPAQGDGRCEAVSTIWRRLCDAYRRAIARARTACIREIDRRDPFPRLADLVRSRHAHQGLCRSISREGAGASSRAMRVAWPPNPRAGAWLPRRARSKLEKPWWRLVPGPTTSFGRSDTTSRWR